MWKFRQQPGCGRAIARDENGNDKEGQSFWPEAASVRTLMQSHVQFEGCKESGKCQFPTLCSSSNKPKDCRYARVVPAVHRVWPEGAPWHGDTGFEAPRTGFGMPLVVRLKGEAVNPKAKPGDRISATTYSRTLAPPSGANGANESRWASPLIIRPFRSPGEPPGEVPQRTLLLLLNSQFPSMENSELDLQPLAAQWSRSVQPGDMKNPIVERLRRTNPPGDAVQAFIDFALLDGNDEPIGGKEEP